jgi:polar amino acid transport system substrate-binding protein
MTEQYPPYNYEDEKDGQLKGITVDILMEMFKKVGVSKTREDLEILPWPRSYKMLLEKPGTALFSTTYTDERLRLFKFVGPIISTRVSLIADKGKALQITSIAQINDLSIGVIRDDIGHQLIRALGVDDEAIKYSNHAKNMVRKLDKGRIDAIAYAEDIARYQFKLAGIDPNRYEAVYVLKDSYMGYAFHKSTDQRVLDSLGQALDELRRDGTVSRIHAKYSN